MVRNKKVNQYIGLKTNPTTFKRPDCSIIKSPSYNVSKKQKTLVLLTGVGARQVVPGVCLFDYVLMDLVPLALCVTPGTERRHRVAENK